MKKRTIRIGQLEGAELVLYLDEQIGSDTITRAEIIIGGQDFNELLRELVLTWVSPSEGMNSEILLDGCNRVAFHFGAIWNNAEEAIHPKL